MTANVVDSSNTGIGIGRVLIEGSADDPRGCGMPSILLAAMALMLLSSGLQAQRSTLDTELPVTAVEQQACEHMHATAPKEHSTDIWFNPFQLKGIQPEAGQKITGVLFPRTPVFLFYFKWHDVFADFPISYPKAINCFSYSSLDGAGKITWSNVPDGEYLVSIISQTPKVYHGSHSSLVVNQEGPQPGLVNVVNTPYTDNYVETHILQIAITTKGGKLEMAPEWGVVR
jgi:hypothetical protein